MDRPPSGGRSNDERKPDGAGSNDNPWRPLGTAVNFGITTLAAMLLGFFGGQWLDRQLGTTPWLAVLGLVLGAVAGFRILLRDAGVLGEPRRKKGDRGGERGSGGPR